MYGAIFQGGSRGYPGFGYRRIGSCSRPDPSVLQPYLQRKFSYRRSFKCGKKRGKTAGRKNAFISGRSEQYGLFRCSDHWRKGNCGSDGNRNGYPDRDHCFPDEPHSGKENTFAGQFRPVFRPSGLRNYGDLRGDLSDQPVSQGACIRCPDVCGSAGGCSHPGGSWLHCDHCPGNGNPENGKRACSHKGPESSGKFRLCICDLF